MASNPDPASARDRLLKVATRLFIEHGFAGTPVSRIVRESGVTMPVLYALEHIDDLRDGQRRFA
jgi:AcrR family transcriptional regulator